MSEKYSALTVGAAIIPMQTMIKIHVISVNRRFLKMDLTRLSIPTNDVLQVGQFSSLSTE